MEHKKYKFWSALDVGIFSVCTILPLTVVIFVLLYISFDEVDISFKVIVIIVSLLGIASVFIIIRHCFCRIILDSEGLTKKLFGITIKRIKWIDLQDIVIANMFVNSIFLSDRKIEDINYFRLVNKRWVIQISYSAKIIEAIKEFTPLEIRGLSDD